MKMNFTDFGLLTEWCLISGQRQHGALEIL